MRMFGKSKKKKAEELIAEESRSFNYKIGEVNLDFKLRVDIKDELVTFKKLLERGLEDVQTELDLFEPEEKKK